ncbi:MAG TPA: leucyl aminopeptidase family protein [Phaeodactylibacter sp.]|nr:leucyl aminopeptidase family protein [Phaeodactylibacter sp.]
MNTKISVSRTNAPKNDLIILCNKKDLAWATSILSASEVAYLKSAAKKEINFVFIPKTEQNIIVQFLKKQKNRSYHKEDVRLAGNEILAVLGHYKIEKVEVINHCKENNILEYVEGMALGNYQFVKYWTDKKERKNSLQEIKIGKGNATAKEVQELKAVVEATCLARDLVNEPQSYLTAPQFSKEIQKAGKEAGFSVQVFDKKKIEQLKMGGILAVNKGSVQPPRFNILTWKPKNAKNKKPIVLVGKGIVYDTGGLSLKPTANSMDFMKCDMGGGATVVGAMSAIAKAKLPLHVIALVPSTDNRPSLDAYAPGDVITMYDGTTVEVLNTDAEGRLVLADALHYAKKYKPELVMDFATLTGAASRAIGEAGICFMGNADQSTKTKLEESGYNVYERLVEFPLWREYGEQIKSNIADIKNLGGPAAGMITAGKFLEHFTDDKYPWVHFDIAGSAYLKSADGYRTKEGTGAGVRLMFDFLKKY